MAEEKGFFDKLQKFLSTTVLIQTKDEKKIKALDVDKLQFSTNLETNRVIDRYSRIHGKGTSSTGFDYLSNYSYLSGIYVPKTELYQEYEMMDMDSILSSALDIYADESTIKSEFNKVLDIKSSSEKVQKSLENLFYDVLNIDFNLWSWIRNMTKYGDFYLKLDITEKVGITNVIPLSPYGVLRIEDPTNPSLVQFKYDNSLGVPLHQYRVQGDTTVFENYEVAHFRLISDSNFLPYGKAMLEGARKVWKQLTLMEDAMMIHRIMRAPEKRIFKVDVGNIPPNEVDNHMSKVINKLKKVPYMDEKTGQYNLRFNMQNMLEDFYLPVRGDRSGTEIDTLSGMEFTGIEDIDYLRNRLLAALKIPKAFLGYEEEINAKATLSAEDVRFSHTIERIQRIAVSELVKIGIVHLFSQGFRDDELTDFTLALTPASTVHKMEQVELWTQQISLARDIKELKMLPDEWIYKTIFDMSEEEAERAQEGVIEDVKRNFRHTQIEDEGNDPVKTGEAINTKNGEVKEPIKTSYIDRKAYGNADKPKTDAGLAKNDRSPVKKSVGVKPHGFNGNSPLSMNELKKMHNKLVKKTFSEVKKEDTDKGTFLDEKNIKK